MCHSLFDPSHKVADWHTISEMCRVRDQSDYLIFYNTRIIISPVCVARHRPLFLIFLLPFDLLVNLMLAPSSTTCFLEGRHHQGHCFTWNMYRPPSARLWCYIQSKIPSPKQHHRSISKAPTTLYDQYPARMSSSQTGKNAHLRAIQRNAHPSDWNSNDEFFKFTCGRFIVDEADNLWKREIRFDLNRLASVAADSVGATRCISIKKYPDDMFNKAFLMSMDDGQEVIAKVSNPNAGVPDLTTASEVAMMDFVGFTWSWITAELY